MFAKFTRFRSFNEGSVSLLTEPVDVGGGVVLAA